MTIQSKAIEKYFYVVLFIMLYKVGLTLKSVNETLVCDHSNESYWEVLACGTMLYMLVLSSLHMNLKCVAIEMKAIEEYLQVAVLLIML